MSASQSDKAERFRALHQGPRAFVIPNPWDAGSARVLTALGFQALATSSGAQAGVLGRRDGRVTRDEALRFMEGQLRLNIGCRGWLEPAYWLLGSDIRRLALTLVR